MRFTVNYIYNAYEDIDMPDKPSRKMMRESIDMFNNLTAEELVPLFSYMLSLNTETDRAKLERYATDIGITDDYAVKFVDTCVAQAEMWQGLAKLLTDYVACPIGKLDFSNYPESLAKIVTHIGTMLIIDLKAIPSWSSLDNSQHTYHSAIVTMYDF